MRLRIAKTLLGLGLLGAGSQLALYLNSGVTHL